jgi:flagellar M-ring protein FliF
MEQVMKFINGLNASQRAVILGGFSLLFLFLMGLLIYSNIKSKDEKLIYTISTNLTKSQVMLASNELEAAAIPYAIVGSGNNLTLKTDRENINIAKIKLVTSSAATTKHTGWEIFDKSSLGSTNFENQVKYLRALEGELGRSLESITGILSASVKIAIPKESVFTKRKVEPSASAVLNLREGTALSQKQITGIKNFIASAVPKLKPKNIKLINQNGSLLEHSKDDIDAVKYLQHERYKTKLEYDFQNKIQDLLVPFLGESRVISKVSIELDFTKKVIQEEIYAPEGTIRSQATIEKSTTSNGEEKIKKAIPGAEDNIKDPNGNGGVKTTKSTAEEAKNTTNYEITKKVVNQKNDAYAEISKITAAVTFDSSILDKVENKEEFLKNIDQVVKEAIGYKKDRGDGVTVRAFKFIGLKPIGEDGAAEGEAADGLGVMSMDSMIKEYAQYIQYLVAMVLLFVFYKKFIAENQIEMVTGDGTASSAGTLGMEDDDLLSGFDENSAKTKLKAKVKSDIMRNLEGLSAEEAAKYEVLIERIDKSVSESPEDIANMITMLLAEGDSKFKQ